METSVKTVLLILDESGAKGYDDNKEQHQGELGVMAGFALPESATEVFTSGLSEIVQSISTDGKLHITDLEPEAQETLRSQLFDYFIQNHVSWFYEAIYVQGFHETHNRMKQSVEEAMQARRSPVKLSRHQIKESLHGELFQGAFAQGLAWAKDNVGPRLHLKVITDRVDAPVLNIFKTQVDELLNMEQPDRTEVTGFDIHKQEIVKGTIEIGVASGCEDFGDFSGITYNIECDDNVLTLAADILANSVHHHLKQIQNHTPGLSINSPEAIQGHPLQKFVYGTAGGMAATNFADTLFRHPKSRGDSDQSENQ